MDQGLTYEFRAMASPCRLRIDGVAARDASAARAAESAAAEVARIERKYSRYRPDSILSRINAAAGSAAPVPIDEETAQLLRFAAQLHDASEGLFDISSGVLRRAWDFRAGRLPTPDAVRAVLPLVGWQRVRLADGHVALPEAGMEIDLGGIGKEYAADRAATVLREAGFDHGYVNLGGDIRLLGPMRDGRPWLLGIAHPRRPGALAAELLLSDGALATSGDYERYIDHGGRRYCHILDPFTGWPAQGWQSVSVVAPACVAAGALATIAMLLGSGGPAFLRAQGVSHVLVDAHGELTRWCADEEPAAAPSPA
ncbi:MAG TPA: FAD:protein FMN transferase [Burkholderiaceae bacterium]